MKYTFEESTFLKALKILTEKFLNDDHNISLDENNAFKFIFLEGVPKETYPITFSEFIICNVELLFEKNAKDLHLE